MIKVPDLTANNALEFSGELQDYQLSEGEVFDFSEVHNCDPFPMLVVSRTIWQLRKHSDVKNVWHRSAKMDMQNICVFIGQ